MYCRVALQKGEITPACVRIVTGWGKYNKRHAGESPLKAMVEWEVGNIRGPFKEMVGNPGRLEASGTDVRTWLINLDADRLVLKDTSHPQPAEEPPFGKSQ